MCTANLMLRVYTVCGQHYEADAQNTLLFLFSTLGLCKQFFDLEGVSDLSKVAQPSHRHDQQRSQPTANQAVHQIFCTWCHQQKLYRSDRHNTPESLQMTYSVMEPWQQHPCSLLQNGSMRPMLCNCMLGWTATCHIHSLPENC